MSTPSWRKKLVSGRRDAASRWGPTSTIERHIMSNDLMAMPSNVLCTHASAHVSSSSGGL